MTAGTLIEAPPIQRADINDRIAVDRGGVEWTGWVRALNGDSGALMQWDNGSQGGMLWSEKWRKLPKETTQSKPAPAPLYPTCDNAAAVTVELSRIEPFPLNPREFRKLPDGSIDPDQHGLRALAASLTTHGQQQPIIVRPLGHGRFGLVDGERRYWAATLSGLSEVRVEVRELDDLQALVSTIAASSHAEAYPIADQARAVRYLLAKDRSQAEIAGLLGTNQQTISVLSRYNGLPGQVQQLVRDGHLQLGHVRQLVREHLLRVPKALIWIAEHAVETHASVRRLEAEIPFEEEMPADLVRQLRPQPAMELAEPPPSPAEATPPPAGLSGDLQAYSARLRTLSTPELQRELVAQREAGSPARYQAVAGQLRVRKDAGEPIPYCDSHSRFRPCTLCDGDRQAEERVDAMAAAAGIPDQAGELKTSAGLQPSPQVDYSQMSKEAILEELDAHEAAGIVLPTEQHNARIDALVDQVEAEMRGDRPSASEPERPTVTSATDAQAPAPKPNALKSAEEIVSGKAAAAGQAPTVTPSTIGAAVLDGPVTMCMVLEDCVSWLRSDNFNTKTFLARLKSAAYQRGQSAAELLASLEA